MIQGVQISFSPQSARDALSVCPRDSYTLLNITVTPVLRGKLVGSASAPVNQVKLRPMITFSVYATSVAISRWVSGRKHSKCQSTDVEPEAPINPGNLYINNRSPGVQAFSGFITHLRRVLRQKNGKGKC